MKTKPFLCILSALAIMAATGPAFAQRESRTIDDGWLFRLGESPDDGGSAAGTGGWTAVNLPHTWNTDAYDVRDYYRGTGWYRRDILLPPHWQGRRIVLRMDAASKMSEIFVNGRSVGTHAGGYTAFAADITPYLDFGSANTLAVRVDNASEDVAPISGDFTFFGGIYRNVWLIALPEQHFDITDMGSAGVFVSTPSVDENRAELRIRGSVRNDSDSRAALTLETEITDPDGGTALRSECRIAADAGAVGTFDFTVGPILRPRLWSPEDPALYRVTLVLRGGDGRELDRSEHYAGMRWFGFDPDEGFFLNGKPYKLRGICRHQDRKPIGVALTDDMHRQDFRLMKRMGANFIRISHYPQDDALLEMCDREGMLVWEEIPVIDLVPDSETYADNCERNLREMIRQHYNHPSVVAWGYMNEILLVTQRLYSGSELLAPAVERTLALARRLESALKQEDDTRVSTMAFHGSDSYNTTGLSGITDVVGWNLYQGWYGGETSDFEAFLAQQHAEHPSHPIIVSEYGAGSDGRLHSLSPRAFDFSIEYQQRFLEHYLPVLERTPYLCGGTHWNFIDFGSAARDESMPRINNKGLVYSDRTPKDVYYYYMAMWRDDVPVLHIASRDWSVRAGVRRGGEPVVQPVKIYTNLPEVELVANGRSLGCVRVSDRVAVFDVPFDREENLLLARGAYRGEEVTDGMSVGFRFVEDRPAGPNTEIAVNVGSDCFYSGGDDVVWLPDRPYAEGGWGYVGGRCRATQTQIAATDDNPLYQTMREDIESYRFDVPAGDYEIELLFADPYADGTSSAYMLGRGGDGSGAGRCRFDIDIDGRPAETSFVPSRNGCFRALRMRHIVRHRTGTLEIGFTPVEGHTMLSAIKLRRL